MSQPRLRLVPGGSNARPAVRGPLPGPPSIVMTDFDLAAHGYVRQEWLLSGWATRLVPEGRFGSDGRWRARQSSPRPYTTRLVVVRPTAPARFDGTVAVEWLNVSSGRDMAPEWIYLHRQLLRSGGVWVGVSAQKAGIDGSLLARGHLRHADPLRYADLEHPGDAFAYDIFAQAAQVIRRPGGPLRPLRPTTLIGMGASQSAMFLLTYVNAVDPLSSANGGSYDGFLLHGRGVRGAWLDGRLWDPLRALSDSLARPSLSGHRIRADVRVPVLTVQSETDVVLLGGRFARQPDDRRHRLWEIAGAAHFDTYALQAGSRDDGRRSTAELATQLRPTTSPAGLRTSAPVNGGPQQHYVLQAGYAALIRWARGGEPPPTAAPLTTRRLQPLRLERDRYGIARGGVRTPFVDIPTATYSGLGQLVPGFGILAGTTHAHAGCELQSRYPGGEAQYVREFATATARAVTAGHLLAEDAGEIIELGTLAWRDAVEGS